MQISQNTVYLGSPAEAADNCGANQQLGPAVRRRWTKRRNQRDIFKPSRNRGVPFTIGLHREFHPVAMAHVRTLLSNRAPSVSVSVATPKPNESQHHGPSYCTAIRTNFRTRTHPSRYQLQSHLGYWLVRNPLCVIYFQTASRKAYQM